MQTQKSSPEGPIEIIAKSIGDAVERHHKLNPQEKALARSSGGSGLIAFCLYALIAAPGLVFASWIIFAIWAGLLGFGALWVYVGVKGATGARDIMAGFWSGMVIVAILALMTWGAYLPADWALLNFLLQGVYIAAIVGNAVRLWISVRGTPGMKLDAVRAQQAHGRARDATESEAAAKLGEREARPQRQFQD